MMDATYVPLFAGFVGAVIGSLSSIVTMYVQARIGDRRERMRQVTQLAIEDHKASVEVGKMQGGKLVELSPIVVYLHYYALILDALERDKLTSSSLKEIRVKNAEVTQTIQTFSKDRVIPTP